MPSRTRRGRWAALPGSWQPLRPRTPSKEADLDHDGQLTFEEFQKWYSRTQPSDRGAAVNTVKSAESAAAPHIQEVLSMADVRRITNLESLHVSDVFERFATVTC